MKTLTKEDILKFPMTTYGRLIGKQLSAQVVGELLQYKVLGEQIGCPLKVIIEATQNGVYYEDDTNHMRYLPVDLHFNLAGNFVLYYSDDEYLFVKNYKKTWWLKKDKSE